MAKINPGKWPAWVSQRLTARQLYFFRRVAQAPAGLSVPVHQSRNHKTLKQLQKLGLVEYSAGAWRLITHPMTRLATRFFAAMEEIDRRNWHPEPGQVAEDAIREMTE